MCGKVPFDDQSMPALHAKIKRGLVEYPAWLSNECKSLLGRMLVTNPEERANLTEVLNHPFMSKGGYDGPPASHLIHREPLRAEELDMEVIKAMDGFTFGTPEQIREELQAVLLTESYLSCTAVWDSRRDRKRGPGMSGSSMALIDDSPKKKRFSGFDLKKRIFKEEKRVEEPVIREKEALDPTRGFDPLISIYFLAREKMERGRYTAGVISHHHRVHLNHLLSLQGLEWRFPVYRHLHRLTRWVSTRPRRMITHQNLVHGQAMFPILSCNTLPRIARLQVLLTFRLLTAAKLL